MKLDNLKNRKEDKMKILIVILVIILNNIMNIILIDKEKLKVDDKNEVVKYKKEIYKIIMDNIILIILLLMSWKLSIDFLFNISEIYFALFVFIDKIIKIGIKKIEIVKYYASIIFLLLLTIEIRRYKWVVK